MTIELSDASWFKSSRSGASNECVEVAWLDAGRVGVRDSKKPAGSVLVFAPAEWSAFTAAIAAHRTGR